MDHTAQRLSSSAGLTRSVGVIAVLSSIPIFMLGLYVVQRPRIGWLGLVGAVAYAYVYFTRTVLVALVALVTGSSSWSALEQQLGVWVVVHGAVMVGAGLAFGVAVVRAGVLPRWTAFVLMTGVVLVAVSSGLPTAFQTASAGIRDLGFGAMGFCLLARPSLHKRGRRDQPTEREARAEVPSSP